MRLFNMNKFIFIIQSEDGVEIFTDEISQSFKEAVEECELDGNQILFIVDESVNDDTMFSVTFYNGVTEDIKFSQIVDSCQNHLDEDDENYVDSIVRK